MFTRLLRLFTETNERHQSYSNVVLIPVSLVDLRYLQESFLVLLPPESVSSDRRLMFLVHVVRLLSVPFCNQRSNGWWIPPSLTLIDFTWYGSDPCFVLRSTRTWTSRDIDKEVRYLDVSRTSGGSSRHTFLTWWLCVTFYLLGTFILHAIFLGQCSLLYDILR